MTYKDNTSGYLGINDKMKVGAGATKTPAAPKAPNAKKPKKTKKEKQGDMENVAAGLKGGQMLIKTLFPPDEPIPSR